MNAISAVKNLAASGAIVAALGFAAVDLGAGLAHADTASGTDSVSVTEVTDTEQLSPFSTYPSPTNHESRTEPPSRYRGYQNVPTPATPPIPPR
jgi:hypothetical protein